MKKIAIVFSGDSKALNGAALYVNRFITIEDELIASEMQPIICDNNKISNRAANAEEAIEIEKEYASSRVHALKNRVKLALTHTYVGNKIFLNMVWEKPGKEAIYKNREKIESSDAVLANDIFSAYYTMQMFPKKPIFFIMHNSGQLLSMFERRLPYIRGRNTGKRLERIAEEIFSKSKKIIFVSRNALELFRKEHPEHASKCVYIPVGIKDAEHLPEHPISPVAFVCVGTVCTRKNQLSIVKAMRKVDHDKAKLTIVGGGEKLQECVQYAVENGLDNVSFPGSVESILEYLNKSSVFVMASLDEGLPAVGVEALRAGLPVLTTDVGGCSELIDNNGALIAGSDPESIANAMNEIIASSDQIQAMGKKSREMYEKSYSIQAMISEYKKILVDEEYGE